MVRLALIGCGAIGSTIARMVEDMPEIEAIYLYDRSRHMKDGLGAAGGGSAALSCGGA